MIIHILYHIFKSTTRSIFLLAVNVVIIVFFAILVFIQNVTNNYYGFFVEEEGCSFFVGTYSGGESFEISPLFIKELQQIEHVIGYNMSATIECNPSNFINIPYKPDPILSSEEDNGQVRLVGNYNTSLYDTFRRNEMVVKQGRTPDEAHPGALIDEDLAQKNKLSIGDTIEFDSSPAIEVIGIYRTLNVPKIRYDTYFATASKSYIFCDLGTLRSISEFGDLYTHMDVYVENYTSMENVESRLYDLCENWTDENVRYYAVNNIENRISIDSGYSAVVGISNVIPKVLIASVGLSLVILFLMTLLWIKDHCEAFGIYRILGKPTCEVALIIFVEILLISLSSAIIAGGIILLVLKVYSADIINLATTITSSSFGDLLQQNEAIKNSINYILVVKTSLIVFFIETISYIFAVSIIARLNWRILLSESK